MERRIWHFRTALLGPQRPDESVRAPSRFRDRASGDRVPSEVPGLSSSEPDARKRLRATQASSRRCRGYRPGKIHGSESETHRRNSERGGKRIRSSPLLSEAPSAAAKRLVLLQFNLADTRIPICKLNRERSRSVVTL